MANFDNHQITFFPLGNADTTLIDVRNGQKKVLFDYAHMRSDTGYCTTGGEQVVDRRCDLPKLLRADLKAADRNYYDVVAFTHLHGDHTDRADEFFYLDYSAQYQSDDRIRIKTMWIPAAVLIDSRNNLDDSAKRIQAEAQFRFKRGNNDIVVFSRPDRLRAWCDEQGIVPGSRDHLIYDAGTLAPGFSLDRDGVEFFIHAPMAWSQDEREVVKQNDDCLVMQALFEVGSKRTSFLITSDTIVPTLSAIVRSTKKHGNEERLVSHIYKNPHHCSYLSVGEEKGNDKTIPHPDVKWLLEVQGQSGLIQIISSEPIPSKGSKEDIDPQPPHREAYAYYEDVDAAKRGTIEVTMEFPNRTTPQPIKIVVGSNGGTVERLVTTSAGYSTSHRAGRAG